MLYFCGRLYGIMNMYELITKSRIGSYEYPNCYIINKNTL